MILDGLTIIDKAFVPPKRGTIVSFDPTDGTVLVAWKPGQVTRVTPVADRYDVELPQA